VAVRPLLPACWWCSWGSTSSNRSEHRPYLRNDNLWLYSSLLLADFPGLPSSVFCPTLVVGSWLAPRDEPPEAPAFCPTLLLVGTQATGIDATVYYSP